MPDENGPILEQFLLNGGYIKIIFVSNKTNILEIETVSKVNCDADMFYQIITEQVEFLSQTHSNVSCILKMTHPGSDEGLHDYMRIS